MLLMVISGYISLKLIIRINDESWAFFSCVGISTSQSCPSAGLPYVDPGRNERRCRVPKDSWLVATPSTPVAWLSVGLELSFFTNNKHKYGIYLNK